MLGGGENGIRKKQIANVKQNIVDLLCNSSSNIDDFS